MSDRRLDQFTAGNSLGGGTCGTVFEVEEDDSLVIKRFNSMAIDRHFLNRNFERLKAMPPVEGMAQVHDYQLDTAPYLALSERIRGDKLPSLAGIREAGAWKVIRLLADTLGHAHKHGVFHGHLHPDNILLETEGKSFKPVVTDFGTGMIGEIHHIDLGDSTLYAAPE